MFFVFNIMPILLLIIVLFLWPRVYPLLFSKLLNNQEFSQKISEKAQLFDIRENQEYRRQHILGARNIPASQFDQSLSSFSKEKEILLYENGNPTKAVTISRKLKKAGFENIYILKGGLSKWSGKVKENR
ncbi:MAG: rhodanese-like domain-containing protein [Lactovum sp.]